MFDANKLMNQLLGGETVQKSKDYLSDNKGGIAGGAVAGGLAGYMMGSKKGRKMAKKAATYGGLALLAGVAYKAYNNYQQNKSTPHGQAEPELTLAPADSNFALEDQTGSKPFATTLVSAMIAAAKADGQIDGAEQQAIFGKIQELELGAEEKAFLFDQLNQPMNIDGLVAAASSREQAVEIYLASLMAIEVDTPAEQAYLSMLAARLNLEPELVAEIHNSLTAATQ
ncbi:MAG: tellurite resistance TerB family protein [Cellvibrionaceae bacterium]|nr:tellurite resistance TerB family protein [Cellvibrionaceae bacterium]